MTAFQHWLGILLAFAFAGGAIANLAGPRVIRQAYRDWGYPNGFHYVTGLLNTLAAGLLAFETSRSYGAAVALLVTFSAIATLGYHGEWSKTPTSFLFVALLIILLI